MAKTVGIQAQGLAELRRDFKRMSREMRLALDRELREVANPIRDKARLRLREKSKNPRGRIERTIRTSVTAKGVSVYSKHPGAPVQHWGGTIKPRGTPIKIEGKRFIWDVVKEAQGEILVRMGTVLDHVAEQTGRFHGP